MDATRADKYVVYLTKGDNFRHKLATMAKYKGNRDKAARPVHYDDIREYLLTYYDAIECVGEEADDALADAQNENTVLCSIDKDLLQVIGKHYNWVKEEKKLVSPEVGLRTLWEQVLTGDATDNIIGIQGCGPVTARKLMEDCAIEEDYRSVAIKAWTEHLSSNPELNERKAPTWIDYTEAHGDELFAYYTDWEGNVRCATPEDIVEEVLMLVKVGERSTDT